jgi:thioredoxin reductase (NADPH)
MEDRARARDNITVKTPYVPEEFIAGDDGKLAKIRLRRVDTGAAEDLDVGGAFVAIGHTPRSELVEGQVDTDDAGYVITQNGSTRTNLSGVFAVGDLVDHTYRQAVTAAGTGTMGALDAEWYLRDLPPSPEAHWAGRSGDAQRDPAEVRAG